MPYASAVPTATVVLGGGHSIGVPLAVSANHSFIVPSATMTLHPVRTSGVVLGVVTAVVSTIRRAIRSGVRVVEHPTRIRSTSTCVQHLRRHTNIVFSNNAKNITIFCIVLFFPCTPSLRDTSPPVERNFTHTLSLRAKRGNPVLFGIIIYWIATGTAFPRDDKWGGACDRRESTASQTVFLLPLRRRGTCHRF